MHSTIFVSWFFHNSIRFKVNKVWLGDVGMTSFNCLKTVHFVTQQIVSIHISGQSSFKTDLLQNNLLSIIIRLYPFNLQRDIK